MRPALHSDFQVREPMHPLFGGMPRTNVLMEVSANQGYTGHQIHVCNFAQQWRSYLDWDTMAGPHGGPLTIRELLTAEERGGVSAWGGGMACVSNVGNMANLTGHILAAANMVNAPRTLPASFESLLPPAASNPAGRPDARCPWQPIFLTPNDAPMQYACGRLAWDPTLPAEDIDREWAAMTFPSSGPAVIDVVADILARSWLVYEGYTSPMGIGFMVGQNNPFGCAPKTNRSAGERPGGAKCPPTPHPPPGVSYCECRGTRTRAANFQVAPQSTIDGIECQQSRSSHAADDRLDEPLRQLRLCELFAEGARLRPHINGLG